MIGPVATRMVLADPRFVLGTARGVIARRVWCAFIDVRGAHVSNHLGMKGIDTLEQLAEVKKIVSIGEGLRDY